MAPLPLLVFDVFIASWEKLLLELLLLLLVFLCFPGLIHFLIMETPSAYSEENLVMNWRDDLTTTSAVSFPNSPHVHRSLQSVTLGSGLLLSRCQTKFSAVSGITMIETETHIKRQTRMMYSKGKFAHAMLQASVPMGSVWIDNVDRKHTLASEVPPNRHYSICTSKSF